MVTPCPSREQGPQPRQRGVWICALGRVCPHFFQPHPHPICAAQAKDAPAPDRGAWESTLQSAHPSNDPGRSHGLSQSHPPAQLLWAREGFLGRGW